MVGRDWDGYFLKRALTAASQSSCLRRHCGAELVRQRASISAGYNGTPFGMPNCDQGGCPRCGGDFSPGTDYELCNCVHAEANAILLAARHGHATEGSVLYATMKPCIGCVKDAIQAGVVEIVYAEEATYSPTYEEAYAKLVQAAGITIRRYKEVVDETGC